MKKILLATTAVVGASLFSQAALAQVQVTTGGYLEFTAGFFDNEDFLEQVIPGAETNGRDFQTEAEVVVRADGKADNGLEYGAQIQIQNNQDESGFGTDEAFLHLGGTWGKVELGDADGVTDVMSVFAPVVEGYEQIDGDYTDYLDGGPVGVRTVNTSDSTKINYYTPNFAGFQAGFSYTPELSEGQEVVAAEGASDYSDWFEGAVNYSHEFGEFGLLVGAGLTTADGGDAGFEDFTAWQLGAQVSWGGFTFGGAYVDNDEAGQAEGSDGEDANGWNVGVAYETGPLTVVANYLDADGTGANDLLGTVEYDDYQAYGAGFVYTVAPGLLVQGDLMFADAEYAGGADADGWVLLLGTRLNF